MAGRKQTETTYTKGKCIYLQVAGLVPDLEDRKADWLLQISLSGEYCSED